MPSFLLILMYLGLGLAMKRSGQFPVQTPVVLNTFVLYLALPALILQNAPKLTLSSTLLIPALTPWLLLCAVVALVLLLRKIFAWSREITFAMLIVLPLGNTAFLGFPMTEAFFGEAALSYALIYDQTGSFIALATYASLLATLYSHETGSLRLTQIVKKLLTFPPFLALVVALFLKDVPYPSLLQTLIAQLAATLVPVIMIAVGFSLHFSLKSDQRSALCAGLLIKLILMPTLALLGCYALDLKGLAAQVAIFEAAMPPMISAGAIAIAAGIAPRLVNSLVGFGLLLSFITLPLWAYLLQR